MSRRIAAALAVATALLARPSPAQQTPNLESLFPRQAPIEVEGSGLARLPLPVEVVAACRPDFSDLRVFDAAGREVPYLVDSGPPVADDATAVLRRTLRLRVAAVQRDESRPDDAPPRHTETYRLALPEELAPGPWTMTFSVNRRELVRRVEIAALLPDGGATPMVEGGSIFRLPSPRRERMSLQLPQLPAASAELEVTLVGQDGDFLEPVFGLETSRDLGHHRHTSVPLVELSRREEAGRTVVELDRPRGLVPDALSMASSTPSFDRELEVWDDGPGAAPEPVGRAEVFRLQGAATVEDLEVDLRIARGDRLRIVVANGDSPPLDDLRFTARLANPALLFHLQPSEVGADGMLRFGGGRAFLPRYDLQSLLPGQVPDGGRRARAAERLWGADQLQAASLGPIEANPAFDPTPALAFAMRPGAVLDPRVFSHRRELVTAPSAEGLNRLRLELEDLAEAQFDLADLRIVDEADQQWAYLLEERATTLRRRLDPAAVESDDGNSVYSWPLPASPATIERLVIDTRIPFFDRPYELWGILDDDEFSIAGGRLQRRVGDPRPIEIGFAPARFDRLELRVEDGDDAPLSFDAATGAFPVPQLYFAAPAGGYSLLLGEPRIGAPSYELERIRDVVLAVTPGEVEAQALKANSVFRRGRRLGADYGRVLLWTGLVLAVAVLAGLTLRLTRSAADPTERPGPR